MSSLQVNGKPITAGNALPVTPAGAVLRDAAGLGYFALPTAGFANPRYMADTTTDATGFDITDAASVMVAFENGATSTVVYEQTLDVTGAAGWFPIMAQIADAQTIPSSAGSTSGKAYIVPALGTRMRVKVTALSVAELRVRIIKSGVVTANAGGVGTVQATVSGAVTVTSGAVTVTTATQDAAVGATAAMPMAAEAQNAQKAAMSAAADKVNLIATMDGRIVVQNICVPDLTWSYAAAASGIVSSTADVALKAALATYRNYLDRLHISHDLLSGVTEFVVKDGATVLFRGKLQTPAAEGVTINFDPPLRGSVNTALNFALISSVTGGVFVNAQGHTGV